MHLHEYKKTYKISAPFTLIRDDGWATCFETMFELGDYIAKHKLRVGRSYRGEYDWPYGNNRVDCRSKEIIYEWIVRDFYGKVVNPDQITRTPQPRQRWWRHRRWMYMVDQREHAARLGLPIPNVGNSKGRKRWRGALRVPANLTANWRRKNAEAVEDCEQLQDEYYFRLNITKNDCERLTQYDYYHAASRMDRSWKQYRKKQWK